MSSGDIATVFKQVTHPVQFVPVTKNYIAKHLLGGF